MTSPCKDCQRRRIGCHNVDECREWREFTEAKEKLNALKSENSKHSNDWEQHLRRHGVKIPRK